MTNDTHTLVGHDDVHTALSAHRYVYADELRLHDALEAALSAARLPYAREWKLAGAAGRIDFLVGARPAGRVGVEVKVAGQPAAVRRQLARYAASPEVASLLLVSTRRTFAAGLPSSLAGKPLRTLIVGGVA